MQVIEDSYVGLTKKIMILLGTFITTLLVSFDFPTEFKASYIF